MSTTAYEDTGLHFLPGHEELAGQIPEYTWETLRNYVEHRLPPGGFVRAVVENNLLLAVGRADASNLLALKKIVLLVYNYMPRQCFAWIGGAE